MKEYFIHSKTNSGKRFTLAAFQKNGELNIRAGVAVCSYKDQFCKRTGRNKALGRAHCRIYTENINSFIDAFQEGIHIAYRFFVSMPSTPTIITKHLREFAFKFAEKN